MKIAAKDLHLLRQVEELGQSRMTQDEIARRVGLDSASALHRRLHVLGFRTSNVPFTEVRVNLPGGNAGDKLSELLARGELVCAEECAAP